MMAFMPLHGALLYRGVHTHATQLLYAFFIEFFFKLYDPHCNAAKLLTHTLAPTGPLIPGFPISPWSPFSPCRPQWMSRV